MNIKSLFKDLALQIEQIRFSGNTLFLDLHSNKKSAYCPYCGKGSRKIHSKYVRKLTDLPILQYMVVLNLTSRKFFCKNASCLKGTFCEQFCEQIKPYQRRTERLNSQLQHILLHAISISEGSRICKVTNTPISTSTALRLIYNLALPKADQVERLGVDDWAYRKGISYGTVLVNLSTRKVIDLLPDRSAASFQEWLKAHPEIKIVSRDRSTDYSSAIANVNNGQDSIIEVADRFHLVKNMFDRLNKYIHVHYKELSVVPNDLAKQEIPPQSEANTIQGGNEEKVDSRQMIFERVKELQAKGVNMTKTARLLKIARQTARKYFGYTTLPVRNSWTNNEYYLIDTYVQEQFSQGRPLCSIYKEVKENGFKGGISPFYYHYAYLTKAKNVEKQKQKTKKEQKKSIEKNIPPIIPPNIITGILIKKITGKELKKQEEEFFIKFMDTLWFKQLYCLAKSFHKIIMGKEKERLTEWMEQTQLYNIAQLNTFIKGLKMDIKAVENAIQYDISNGMVEGFVNKLKTIKRVMYGRAGLELLKRKMIITQT